jgi:hypothetical protein
MEKAVKVNTHITEVVLLRKSTIRWIPAVGHG